MQVVLNVGGSKFTTTLTTLRNAPSSSPSLFTAMFSGRHNLRTDEAGCFFVDRDARHFHAILNYLRDGQLNYPSDGTDFKYLLELRAEAEYYGLTGLVALID
ncbi:POZ domain-containing protein, partial [Haematococcus lacustris]